MSKKKSRGLDLVNDLTAALRGLAAVRWAGGETHDRVFLLKDPYVEMPRVVVLPKYGPDPSPARITLGVYTGAEAVRHERMFRSMWPSEVMGELLATCDCLSAGLTEPTHVTAEVRSWLTKCGIRLSSRNLYPAAVQIRQASDRLVTDDATLRRTLFLARGVLAATALPEFGDPQPQGDVPPGTEAMRLVSLSAAAAGAKAPPEVSLDWRNVEVLPEWSPSAEEASGEPDVWDPGAVASSGDRWTVLVTELFPKDMVGGGLCPALMVVASDDEDQIFGVIIDEDNAWGTFQAMERLMRGEPPLPGQGIESVVGRQPLPGRPIEVGFFDGHLVRCAEDYFAGDWIAWVKHQEDTELHDAMLDFAESYVEEAVSRLKRMKAR